MFHPKTRQDLRNLEFIEIYNGGAIYEDLSGFRISGAVEYQFPNGTMLPAGAFLVVAAVPSDVQAVYGLSGVLGPFTGALANGNEEIRLRDELDRVLVTAAYSDGASWPAAADGAGHSLVLARPSYGAEDVRAWEASTFMGGSPGDVDPVVNSAEQNVMINEFLAHTDDPQPDFIELYNHSNVSVDISGSWLTDDRDVLRFEIPDGTSIGARSHVVFDQNALGFSLSAAGETIYLVNSNGTRVIDAVKFSGQENGISSGRTPDGSPTIRRLNTVTQGTANSRWRGSEVVINEVMYSPISGSEDDEYVELYNPTGRRSAWRAGNLQMGLILLFPQERAFQQMDIW